MQFALGNETVVVGIATVLLVVLWFFVRHWIDGVRQRHLELSERVDTLEERAAHIERTHVLRTDLQRLEDKLDTRHDKQDSKLDRIMDMLMHRNNSGGG